MAEYEVTVQFDNVTSVGGDMTGAQIRDALEALSAGQRLSYNYLDDTPTIPAGDDLTGEEIVTLLSALAYADRLSLTKIKDLIKANIPNLAKALNFRATGNVRSTSFQAASMVYPYAWDMWIADDINTTLFGTAIEDGDWIISLTENPGSYTFTDTTKWYVLKMSRLPVYRQVFKYRNELNADSGIEPIEGTAYAVGDSSFAHGKDTFAYGDYSQASGYGSTAFDEGSRAYAAGYFTHRGDVQIKDEVIRLKTTNATPTEMNLPSTFTLATNKTYKLTIEVVGRVSGGATCKTWEYKSVVSGNGTSILTQTVTGSPETMNIGNPAIACSYTVKTTSPARIQLTVTGLTATEVYWNAYIRSVEVADFTNVSPQTIALPTGTNPITYTQ